MRISIFLTIVMIAVSLFMTPKAIQIALAQADIPMQDVGNQSKGETRANVSSSNSGAEQMTLKAQLKPDPNQFSSDGEFVIKKFGFVTSNGSEICPQNNCKYGVENGQFRPNTYSGGYTFEGRLKVTTQEGDVKKTKFYNFNVDLDKASEEERNGETFQSLEGTFGLGKDTYNPDISYDITNGTLKVDEKSPILTIQAERSPY